MPRCVSVVKNLSWTRMREMDLILVTEKPKRSSRRTFFCDILSIPRSDLRASTRIRWPLIILKDAKGEGGYGKKLRLVHIGSFYRNGRFGRALRALRELEIETSGEMARLLKI